MEMITVILNFQEKKHWLIIFNISEKSAREPQLKFDNFFCIIGKKDFGLTFWVKNVLTL